MKRPPENTEVERKPACQKGHRRILFCLLSLAFLLNPSAASHAGINDIGPPAPYAAPPYVPPPPPVSRLHLLDNGDGTISDPDSGLMWAQKDSYAHLGKCLNWFQSADYVKQLRTGNHDDWRMPTLLELVSIYDDTKETILGWDKNPEHPMALDELFAEGAAYWYWSADYEDTRLTDCCGRSFYYVKGMTHVRRFSTCDNGGVRAVRNAKKTSPQ